MTGDRREQCDGCGWNFTDEPEHVAQARDSGNCPNCGRALETDANGEGTNRTRRPAYLAAQEIADATRERLGYLKVWVLLHHHKHGVDVWPVRAETEAALPEPADFIDSKGSKFEPEKDEWTEWRGPFEVKV